MDAPFETAFDGAVLFALRGLGLKERALERYVKPESLRRFVRELLKRP